jgi:hypothetical protein
MQFLHALRLPKRGYSELSAGSFADRYFDLRPEVGLHSQESIGNPDPGKALRQLTIMTSLKDSREACQEVNRAEWVWRAEYGMITLLCGAGHAGPRPFMTIRSESPPSY